MPQGNLLSRFEWAVVCVYVVVVLSKCVPDVCMLLCKEKRDYVIFVLYRMSHKQHLHLRIIYNLLCCHDLMCASQCILISDWSLQNIYLSFLPLSLAPSLSLFLLILLEKPIIKFR